MPGPRPKSNSLKLLKGENRTERLNPKEPKPQPKACERPAFLSGVAAEIWDEYAPRLERIGVLTEIDGMAFAALCLEFAGYLQYRAEDVDPIQTFATGARQVAPEISVAHKSLQAARALMIEFGMTPSSRTRIEVKRDDEDDFDELINAK